MDNKSIIIETSKLARKTNYEVENIVFSNKITEIPKSLSWLFPNLKTVKFQNDPQIRVFDIDSFRDCKRLEYIELPRNLEVIDEYSFYGCSSLKEINFSETTQLKTINNCAFRDCISLVNVVLPESLEKLGSSVFKNAKNLEYIEFPRNLEVIDEYSFEDCTSLKEINFNETTKLKIIKNGAFRNCISLVSVQLPESLENLGSSVFQNAEKLLEIEIPSKIETLHNHTFYNCISLKQVNFRLNSKISEIGRMAFYGTNNLKEMILPKSIYYIEKDSFKLNDNIIFYIPFSYLPTTWMISEYIIKNQIQYINDENNKEIITTEKMKEIRRISMKMNISELFLTIKSLEHYSSPFYTRDNRLLQIILKEFIQSTKCFLKDKNNYIYYYYYDSYSSLSDTHLYNYKDAEINEAVITSIEGNILYVLRKIVEIPENISKTKLKLYLIKMKPSLIFLRSFLKDVTPKYTFGNLKRDVLNIYRRDLIYTPISYDEIKEYTINHQ